MKYFIAKIIGLGLVFFIMQQVSGSGATDNPIADAENQKVFAQGITDIPFAYTKLQHLWPTEPNAYEACANQILNVLADVTAGDFVQQEAARLLTIVANSEIPLGIATSSALLRLKCSLIVRCIGAHRLPIAISTWNEIEQLQGRVRSQIVQNDEHQGSLNPLDIMQAFSEEEAQMIISENLKKVIFDRWQQELRITDRKLLLLLRDHRNNDAMPPEETVDKSW